MVRSTGLPRQKGLAGLTRVIRARTSLTTVRRVTTSTGSLDEQTTSETAHEESLWLFEPTERVSEELAGERIEGSLGALAVADGTVDMQVDDRVTYGGAEYEIDTVVGHPDDNDADGTASPGTDFWIVSFNRRQ